MSGCEKEVDAWMQNEDAGMVEDLGGNPKFWGAKLGQQLPRGHADDKIFVSVDVFK